MSYAAPYIRDFLYISASALIFNIGLPIDAQTMSKEKKYQPLGARSLIV